MGGPQASRESGDGAPQRPLRTVTVHVEIASGYPHKETKGSFNKITIQPSKGAHPQGSPSEVVHGDASPRGVCVGGGQRGPRGHPLSHPPRSGGICEFRDYGAHVHPRLC